MPRARALHFATTSHGLGHLTRTLAVLEHVHRLLPGVDLHVSTAAEASWLKSRLSFPVRWRRQDYEPGALQSNCFESDPEATLAAYRAFDREYSRRLDQEIRFLRSESFIGVVSDIPALPVRAAAEVGIPAVGLSNFTWDWILEPWCEGERGPIVARLREDYASGTLQLCLPFGPDRSSFPRFEKAPLVARRATLSAEQVRRAIGLPDGPIALVCPGGWLADDWPAIHARPGAFHVLTVGDLPITTDAPCTRLGHRLPDGITMPDLVAASAVVLGKPGYGLASECLAHRTPFAMIERVDFRETPFLTAEMRAVGRCSVLTLDEFFSGDWRDALEVALVGGADWSPVEPDAEWRVARRLVELLDG